MRADPGNAPGVQSVAAVLPLAGARITLVFEYSISHNSRMLQEIEALQVAGATVALLTSHTGPEEPPPGVVRTIAPLEFSEEIPPSAVNPRPLRMADNIFRSVLRRLGVHASRRRRTHVRMEALRRLIPETDLLWVVDYLSLPTAVAAAKGTATRVLYETVDLVPEFLYRGERHRRRSLEEERALLPRLDGFITACDSYADYYMDRYGGGALRRRPVVRDNTPAQVVSEPCPVSSPLRLLFLGDLMFDRPIGELIEAVALTTTGVTLDFRGMNRLGSAPLERITALGLRDRVRILAPCAPAELVVVASAYDAGLVALRGLDENERRASTSKLFTYMAAGLAIIGSDLPGIARVVNEYMNGALVEGMKPRRWAEAMDALAISPPDAVMEMKRRSIDAARLHSWDRQAPLFVAEFRRALGWGMLS